MKCRPRKIEPEMPLRPRSPLTDCRLAYRSVTPLGPEPTFSTTTSSASRGDCMVRSLPPRGHHSTHTHTYFTHRPISCLPCIPMLTGMRLPRSAGGRVREGFGRHPHFAQRRAACGCRQQKEYLFDYEEIHGPAHMQGRTIRMRTRWMCVRSHLRDRGGPSGREGSGDRDMGVQHM